MAPKITAILPIYNGARTLRDAIESIQNQSYTDWELLAINDCESKDGSAEIVQDYAREDPRIQLIANADVHGYASCMNLGFQLANGDYIAEMDANDVSRKDRFKIQYEYMTNNPSVGICGSYQEHCDLAGCWVHRPPTEPEDLKASLAFQCNFCNSTRFFRKSMITENELYFDSNSVETKLEFWSRAIERTTICNIPEILGEYPIKNRSYFPNDPEAQDDSGLIVVNTLNRILKMNLQPEEAAYFGNNRQVFWEETDIRKKQDCLSHFADMIRGIYKQNQKLRVFSDSSLLNQLLVEWEYASCHKSRNWSGEKRVTNINHIFTEQREELYAEEMKGCSMKEKLKGATKRLGKRILKPLWHMAKERLEAMGWTIANKTASEIIRKFETRERKNEEIITKNIENRLQRLEQRLNIRMDVQSSKTGSPINVAEVKNVAPIIKIGILFQIPSVWPSLENVWEILKTDNRFQATMYLFDEEQKEKAQMKGARELLEQKNIPFVNVNRYTFIEEKPDILIYQTPWDENHRPRYLQSDLISKLGIRIAYVLYGLNYSASVWEGHRFSDIKMKAYPWKIYTFSERMKFDHICMSPRGGENVVAVGHPKFDAIANKKKYPLEPEIQEMVAGRKVIFMQMHFPAPDGNPSIPEADIHSYIEFLQHSAEYDDFFFLVRPHPKMLEFYENHGMYSEAEEFNNAIQGKKNVLLYRNPDYRPALFSADYFIGDRSALLLEASALDIPILYMRNYYFKEQMLPAVEPLFESCYQGFFYYDMKMFMDYVVIRGNDYKKDLRRKAVAECLPPLDGQGAVRIVNDIADSFYREEGFYA